MMKDDKWISHCVHIVLRLFKSKENTWVICLNIKKKSRALVTWTKWDTCNFKEYNIIAPWGMPQMHKKDARPNKDSQVVSNSSNGTLSADIEGEPSHSVVSSDPLMEKKST